VGWSGVTTLLSLFCPELYDRGWHPNATLIPAGQKTKLKLGARKMRPAQNNQLKNSAEVDEVRATSNQAPKCDEDMSGCRRSH